MAPQDVDLSHSVHYRKQKGGRNSGRAKISAKPLDPDDIGQPGCTNRERDRFAKILQEGGLVDAYRELVGETNNSGLSWRGNTTGKHAGRGMRIDHCIVSTSLMSSIASVEITGHGTDRIGFLGSDHCPLLIMRRSQETGYAKDASSGDAKAESNGQSKCELISSGDTNTELNSSVGAQAKVDAAGGTKNAQKDQFLFDPISR